MTSPRAVVAANNLSIAYGDSRIIDSASFEVTRGDFVCVVGANGSGKSTLIKALLGLLRPSAGTIIYGDEISRGAIGYLPQEPQIDPRFPATVFEIVLSGTLGQLGRRPFYGKAERRRALDSLKTLGIAKLQNASFSELSGGQKQKVLLARALTATSELLILDEPSNNLDHTSRREFYQVLRDLNRERGLTIIMITHDLDADDLIGDKVLAITDGKVSYHATADYLRSYR